MTLRNALLVSLLAMSSVASAEEAWWFDVEVILFDRNTALTELSEKFDYADSLSPAQADMDLISDVIMPDVSRLRQALPVCGEGTSPLWVAPLSVEDIISQYSAPQSDDVIDAASDEVMATQPEYETLQAGNEYSDTTEANGLYSESYGPTDSEIAGLWLTYFGVPQERLIQFPQTRFCEEQLPFLSLVNGHVERFTRDYRQPAPQAMPVIVEGNDWARAAKAHLLSSQQQALTALSRQIRQAKNLDRLLHISWRQEVAFGEGNAKSVRLFAGQNYASQFTLSGDAITPEMERPGDMINQSDITPAIAQEAFFAELEQALLSPAKVSFNTLYAASGKQLESQSTGIINPAQEGEPIWQIEGKLKVFLKNINRVPYLHIASDIHYRQPVPLVPFDQLAEGEQPEYRLVSVPFNQLRRVISKQLHYFDHPLFGMVVEIRRYRRPADNSAADDME